MAGWDERVARLEAEFPGWHIWRSNAGRWWATRTGTVLRRDAVAALAQEAGAGRKYDLVLVDPPYDMYLDLQPQLARYLPAVLADDGVLVVETGARVEPDLPLPQRTSRKYGQARVTVYEAS